jgi:uncharacterized membrane protein HdeD (DUF308 family)
MTISEYEFSSSQNELIGDLAKKMTFVATLLIVVGVIALIGGVIILISAFSQPQSFPEAINALIQGIFTLLIGTWTRKAGLGFKRIVTTAGSDIENLMGALGELRKLYTLQYWLVILLLVFVILSIVAGIVLGFLGAR